MRNEAVAGLIEFAKTGNDSEVKNYIETHWDEFPVDIQDSLAIALMTDAVRDHVAAQIDNQPTENE